VKEIMTKVMKSQRKDISKAYQPSRELTLDELIEIGTEIGINADEIRKATYEYDHPIFLNSKGISLTHVFIEESFESDLTKDAIWEKIVNELDHYFADNTLEKIKFHPTQKIWTHVDHANHETVVSLTKREKTAHVKISHRVGFFSSPIQGLLHGFYTALIFFGFMFAIFTPSLSASVGILTTLWLLIAVTIFKFSQISRKKKLARLTTLANQMTKRLSTTEAPKTKGQT
jgi:hypothetical protein